MKRTALITSCILFAASCTMLVACKNKGAQAGTSVNTATAPANGGKVDPKTAPVMTFEKESYEFGVITQGEKVHYNFKFTNTGKTPLIIANAVASCGCTVPETPKDPIAPGASGEIKVVFNSAGKMGMQDKVVTITSNAYPQTNNIHLIGQVNVPNSK